MSPTLRFLPATQVQIHVTVRGREWPWLSRLLAFILGPLLRWRAKQRRRLWQPDIDRIIREVERELPGGRSHPNYPEVMATRVAEWFKAHPQVTP